MPSRKSTVILLLILALVMIVGGWWFFNILYPAASIDQAQHDAELRRIEMIKDMSVDNVRDFLQTEKDPDSIWQDLLTNKQFASLEETSSSISLDSVGNIEPFSPQGPAAEPTRK